jgi:hypothetical protein
MRKKGKQNYLPLLKLGCRSSKVCFIFVFYLLYCLQGTLVRLQYSPSIYFTHITSHIQKIIVDISKSLINNNAMLSHIIARGVGTACPSTFVLTVAFELAASNSSSSRTAAEIAGKETKSQQFQKYQKI